MLGLFERWESTGVFFLENVDKNLISRRFEKGVSFSERVGRVGHTCTYIYIIYIYLLTEIHGSQEDSKNPRIKAFLLIPRQMLLLFFGWEASSDSSSCQKARARNPSHGGPIPVDWLGSRVPGTKYSSWIERDLGLRNFETIEPRTKPGLTFHEILVA